MKLRWRNDDALGVYELWPVGAKDSDYTACEISTAESRVCIYLHPKPFNPNNYQEVVWEDDRDIKVIKDDVKKTLSEYYADYEDFKP